MSRQAAQQTSGPAADPGAQDGVLPRELQPCCARALPGHSPEHTSRPGLGLVRRAAWVSDPVTQQRVPEPGGLAFNHIWCLIFRI